MIARSLVFLVLASLASGCGSSSKDGTTDPNSGDVAGGHTLTLNVTLGATDGKAAFMTPNVTIVDVPADTLVGKPYMIATYPAGFSPGNDPELDSAWGVVPADLKISYTTPNKLPDGGYDMVLVIYAVTPVSDEIKKGSIAHAPAPKGGDLSAFTFGVDNVNMKPGDPTITPGVVRLNMAGKDTSLDLANRTPKDPTDQTELQTAFMNTILLVP